MIYDHEQQVWRCCSSKSDGSADCLSPTEEVFHAPAPQNLSTQYPSWAGNPEQFKSSSIEPSPSTSPAGSISSVLPAASSSLSTSSTEPNVPPTTGSKSFSPALPLGQIIGTVAAENIGLILVYVIIRYIWRWRRRRKSSNSAVPEAVPAMKGSSLPFNTAASSSTTFPAPSSTLPDDESLPPGGTSILPEGGWGQRRYI